MLRRLKENKASAALGGNDQDLRIYKKKKPNKMNLKSVYGAAAFAAVILD